MRAMWRPDPEQAWAVWHRTRVQGATVPEGAGSPDQRARRARERAARTVADDE
jgi:hypothetical protein